MGITGRRGFWLRCFLGAALSFDLSNTASAQGIVDCIVQKKIAVSKVHGRVFDPNGMAVPNVGISLKPEASPAIESKSGSDGTFNLNVPAGRYQFRAELAGFEVTTAELEVGNDLFGLLRPASLKVILALPGYNCPWVTTSNKEFKDSTRKNATQK